MSVALSIVIPAYNEQSCIAESLEKVLDFARNHTGGAEIVVVDDGSTDTTASIVEAVRSRLGPSDPPLHLVRHGVNRGKGAGVRTGFHHARGTIVLFTDADLSSPIAEANHLIGAITSDTCDIAIGSRAVDPSLITVQQGAFRRRSGRIFNGLVRRIEGLPLLDTQCGFKAFRREAAAPVFALQRIEGFAFDVEILYVARKFGLRIRELPVHWNHVADSKVSLLTDSVRMFLDLCRIRWNDWRGRYARSAATASPPPVSDVASP